MVSVNIRMGMVQAATPEYLRGRVAAVNMLFIQTSNEGGDFRGGALAGSWSGSDRFDRRCFGSWISRPSKKQFRASTL